MGRIMNNLKKKISACILSGEFLEARPFLKDLSEEDLKDLLFIMGCDEGSMASYAFVCFLIQENETIERHLFASYLLNIAFCHIKGAYESSFYHIRRALELRPNDIELKESLLFFNDIPERVLSDEKAIKIAQEILNVKPTCDLAQEILSKRLVQNKNNQGKF